MNHCSVACVKYTYIEYRDCWCDELVMELVMQFFSIETIHQQYSTFSAWNKCSSEWETMTDREIERERGREGGRKKESVHVSM